MNAPVPHDIPLSLPVPIEFLQISIVALFLLHILFVNLMLGGATLSLACEFAGLRDRKYDELAHAIAKTVTVNKSLAVVLGVGPLLVINLLYTIHFYSANALTGSAWFMVVPLVTLAFLMTYLHKYTWDVLAGQKALHLAIGGLAVALFWSIPLIFLANINLMLFPDRWADVRGFLATLALPNVFPRYLHFLLASLALTGLAGVWWFGRQSFPVAEETPGWTREELQRFCYRLFFAGTLAQFVAGPLVFVSLPVVGISWSLVLTISLGATLALGVLGLTWREVTAPPERLGRCWPTIVILLTAVVLCMGVGRHQYREKAIAQHQQAIADRTEAFHWQSDAALRRAESGIAKVEYDSPGQEVFVKNCKSCHALSSVLVGPSIAEIGRLYPGNAAGIVAWSTKPGKKRPEMITMPAFGHLPKEELQDVAEYLLDVARGEATYPE